MMHPILIAGGWHMGQNGSESATIPSRYHPRVAQNKRPPWATVEEGVSLDGSIQLVTQ